MMLTHITNGLVALHAGTGEELNSAVLTLQDAGYTVTDIENDPPEFWHVATVHYTHPREINVIRVALHL